MSIGSSSRVSAPGDASSSSGSARGSLLPAVLTKRKDTDPGQRAKARSETRGAKRSETTSLGGVGGGGAPLTLIVATPGLATDAFTPYYLPTGGALSSARATRAKSSTSSVSPRASRDTPAALAAR